jgi:ABC-type multidrug transport system permease subunit
MFYLIIFLLSFTAGAIGYFVSSIFSSPETANMVAPIIVMPFILFGGFFANSASYPGWVTWIQYLSPIRYALEALVRNEFLNLELAPGVPNLITVLNFNIGTPACLGILAGFSVFFRIVSLVFLKVLIKKFQ